MTVLKRRDPTVAAIMDSFSHVCLYAYNGDKWEKSGCEGTMFMVIQYVSRPPCTTSAHDWIPVTTTRLILTGSTS